MPPDDLTRYFYFPNVRRADYLFQAVVPHLLGEEPARLDKRAQLAALRDHGVFVIDLKPDPCSRATIITAEDLVSRAVELEPENAILVKVDVYDAAFEALRRAGVSVIDARLPFPSTGRQTEFSSVFATRSPRPASRADARSVQLEVRMWDRRGRRRRERSATR